MRKKDYLIIALLVALLFVWPKIDGFLYQNFFKREKPATTPTATPEARPVATAGTNAAPTNAVVAPVPTTNATASRAAAVEEESASTNEPRTVQLANDKIRLWFSSRGASLTRVELPGYRSHLELDSPPVQLDFTDRPALAYEGLPALGSSHDFELQVKGQVLTATRTTMSGIRMTRTIELTDGYMVEIRDEIANTMSTSTGFPDIAVQTGYMQREPGHVGTTGYEPVGVDTRSPVAGVVHWGPKIKEIFESNAKTPQGLMRSVSGCDLATNGVDWVAAKNKYFVQILTPKENGDGKQNYAAHRATLSAKRASPPNERTLPTAMTDIEAVAASLVYDKLDVPAGTNVVKAYSFYVGPMQLSQLDDLSLNRDEVMEIGEWLKPISKLLLKILNGIHAVIPDYGVAIMLLTVIVRLVFWPITHKSSQSMKRMAEIQPLVKEVQAKYQKDPKRMQAEMMRIYKENRINPVAGCLPMLIQIPFFFALFLVLKSAIELRFADFLWISDLSAPERVFTLPFNIPLLGSDVNFLPILMAGTMYWQQKVTPTAGDPNQAKVMRVVMTGMMFFFLYNYPAGLALYWTTQNLLMILQQVWNKRATPKTA